MLTRSVLPCVVTVVFALGGCGGKTSDVGAPKAPGPAPIEEKASVPAAPIVPELTETINVEAPEFGTLTVKAPGGGRVEQLKPAPGDPTGAASVTFASGPLTQLRVTALGPVGLAPGFGLDESLKREMAAWAGTMKGKTVELELAPELFEAGSVRGYYSTATDANPAPGEPKYLVNGFFRAGDGVLMLGGLSNDAPGAKAVLLAVAKTAVWEGKPKPAEPGAEVKPDESQPPSGKQ